MKSGDISEMYIVVQLVLYTSHRKYEHIYTSKKPNMLICIQGPKKYAM